MLRYLRNISAFTLCALRRRARGKKKPDQRNCRYTETGIVKPPLQLDRSSVPG